MSINADDLRQALAAQEEIVDDVRAIRLGQRLAFLAVGLLAVLSIVVAVVGFSAHNTATDIHDLVEAEEREEELEDLERCRLRNSTPQAVRDAFGALGDVLEAEFPDEVDLINRIRHSAPDAGITDVDCDGDGELTAADYAR